MEEIRIREGGRLRKQSLDFYLTSTDQKEVLRTMLIDNYKMIRQLFALDRVFSHSKG